MSSTSSACKFFAGIFAMTMILDSTPSAAAFDQQKYADYINLRDCTAMTAAAAFVSAREFGHVSPLFHHFWVATQTGEAILLYLIDSGVVSPTGELLKMDFVEAEWEPYVDRNVEILDEDSEDGEAAWIYAKDCAEGLKR